MAEMTDEEALANMERERASPDRPRHLFYGSLENAYRALKEKVEKARAAAPKRPSLKELAEAITASLHAAKKIDVTGVVVDAGDAKVIADILRVLDDVVVPCLKMCVAGAGRGDINRHGAETLLRALGEDVV